MTDQEWDDLENEMLRESDDGLRMLGFLVLWCIAALIGVVAWLVLR